MRAIRGCKALLLMCSDAALRSRNVSQEILLAWKYARPYLPLLLEPISFPEQVEYWLEGWQWVEVLERPPEAWLPEVLRALAHAGIHAAGLPPEGQSKLITALRPVHAGLHGLLSAARFTDRIWPVPADAVSRGMTRPTLRDLGEAQDDARRIFRLGERVCVCIESEREGHLLLLDLGTTGKVYCLCPSWFAPEAPLGVGRTYLPQARGAAEAFTVTGRPGREQLLAVVTDEPLGLDWLPPETDKTRTPARVLGRENIDALLARLGALEGDRWVALSTYFDVAW